MEPVELPVDPVPIDEPEEPVLGELLVSLLPLLPVRSDDDGFELVPPVAPEADDPLDPVEPLPVEPVWAHAGAATSNPAAARLATLPHSIFTIAYPSALLWTTRHPALASCWLPKR